ncbi:hypothetical protein JD844_015163 [Phrynosoma platyrhinos]|uniref:Alpha-carbonic anhydrase domain-containing protein n=1 Tax=Phrynosoma platyrhinos TaxID=52577 RepID=A0ABQ7T7F3_PHRPL|nr:hypothetical protein JD844_015163 [Phrynosoma platyrhinos]
MGKFSRCSESGACFTLRLLRRTLIRDQPFCAILSPTETMAKTRDEKEQVISTRGQLLFTVGPLHWKEIMPTCGGENQSPINIDRRKAQRNKDLDELLFEGYDQAPPGRWRLLNDGHTDDYVDLASTFSLSNLLPNMALLSKYYRYKGSLTTPSCDEVVTWTVFEEQIPISKPQLNAFVNTLHFRKVGTMSLKMTNNFRPVQPLHSRKVFASKDATISCCSPLAASLFFPLFLAFLAGQFSWPS